MKHLIAYRLIPLAYNFLQENLPVLSVLVS